ncbi:cupin domain-containing protein [Aliiglaciecola sp. SL4]|uniref:cupin domain-containing protein n=1 Tax=Aliiglaciecola sp. SL4 TaxID=3239806 RepID=UPI00355C2F16
MPEDITKTPWWAVVEPEEGESYWQPEPSNGFVTMKFSPDNTPYDTFTSGTQVLPPGCHVREHGHKQNHELIFIHKGTGICKIEDETYELKPGVTVLFGRYARHIIENTGDEDLHMFWVFFPPALENWFRAIGKLRIPGDEPPAHFPRPDGVESVMEQLRFVPPKPKSED